MWRSRVIWKWKMEGNGSNHSITSYLLLTYGFSWAIVVPIGVITSSIGVQFAAVTVSAFGPLIAAAILVRQGGSSLRRWFRDMLKWRVQKRWYLAAIGIPLLGVVVQTVAYTMFFGDLDLSVLPQRVMILLGTFPLALLLTGGNEEFGWRGFMLPELQRTYSALTASIVIGVCWLIWHLPSDLFLTALGNGWTWSPDRIAMRLGVIPLAIILTWIYNSSRGSVLLAMIFHAGWNSMSILVPVPLGTASLGAATAPSVSSLRILLVSLMTIIAFAIIILYDRETLSKREKYIIDWRDIGSNTNN